MSAPQGPTSSQGSPAAGGPEGIDEIQEAIAETREDLARTVDALAAKADVKGRATASVEQAAQRVRTRVEEVSTDERGDLRPVVPVGAAVAAVAAVAVVVWLVRRGRSR
ncbi:DUF3618 domain-containing protein [Nocardioides mangrovicus]|uniref:DUF3618 domain-containing protein n=1 Tax=Nocardioides mangrovicus TaxID=2478913 RepID=A0A3L8P4S1_9ACTN|nr:DUF3618 domain-containing protein [Nocardioides mangrovicus]RLV50350.1 DUF3618 domain-containing protein [Nocardioides mangrovicus]